MRCATLTSSPTRLGLFILMPWVLLVACGGGDNGGGSSTPSASAMKLAYVANWNSGNVSTFGVNSDGSVTALLPPTVAGQHPHTINVDPAARFVYVANHESDFLSGYTVNKTTGALAPVPAATLTTGDSPHASVFDKSGKFLYVVNGIAAAQITANIVNADGTLTRIGAPIPTGAHSHNLGIDPSGRFIYVASQDSNQIFAFTVNQSTGGLTQIPGSPYAGTSGPLDAVVDQTTQFAYVSNSGGEIQAFMIDPATGGLTPIGVILSGGLFAHTIVIDHTNNFLYTGNINSNNVSGFQINHSSGALTAVQGSPFATGNQPEGVTLHPTDEVLFVTNFGDQNVSRFSINSTTGQLTLSGIFQDTTAPGSVSGPISVGITD